MKAKIFFVSAALILSLCVTGPARAALELELGHNTLTFTGFETGIPTTFGDPFGSPLGIGSVFIGALNVSSIFHTVDGTTDTAGQGGNPYLTALFAAQVTGTSVNTLGQTVYSLGAYQEGKYASIDALIPTSLQQIFGGSQNATVMSLYQTSSLPSIAAGNTLTQFNTIVDGLVSTGTLWSTIGYGSKSSMDTSITTPSDVLLYDKVFANFKFVLSTTDYIGNNADFYAGDVTGSLGLSRTYGSVNNGSSNFWQINASSTADVSAATPEPATVLFMGAGLLGIFGLRRKSRQ